MNDLGEFEYCESAAQFADFDDQIYNTLIEVQGPSSERQYRIEPTFFRRQFPQTELYFSTSAQEDREIISEVIVPEIFGPAPRRAQLLERDICAYRSFVFEAGLLLGYIGKGTASSAAIQNYLIVLTEDFLSVFDTTAHESVVRVDTMSLFPRTPADLMPIPAAKGAAFSLLLLGRSGLIYLCSAFKSDDKVEIGVELVCSFPWATTFEYSTLSQGYHPTISNNGAGNECVILVSYWNKKEHFVFINVDTVTLGFEIVAWSDNSLKEGELVFSNDCIVHTRGKLEYTPAILDVSCSEVLCSVRNPILAFILLFVRVLSVLFGLNAKKGKLEFSNTKILHYNQAEASAIVEVGGQVCRCQANLITATDVLSLLHNTTIIPGIEAIEHEERQSKPVEMQLSYSFYEKEGIEDQWQQTLGSLSSSLMTTTVGSDILFASVNYENGFLIVQTCNRKPELTIHNTSFKLKLEESSDVRIDVLPSQIKVDFYNPFYTMETFDFRELDFAYHLCYDCTENCEASGILHYIFKENEVSIGFVADKGVGLVVLHPGSLAAHFLQLIKQNKPDQFCEEFELERKKSRITSISMPIAVQRAIIYEQKRADYCYLYKQVLSPDSPMFLNLRVVDLLCEQKDVTENVVAVFEGVRQLADYQIFLKFGDQVLAVLNHLFELLILHEFDGQNATVLGVQTMLIMDEFAIELEMLKLFAISTDENEFVHELSCKEQEFVTLAEHELIYGVSLLLRGLGFLLGRHAGSAIIPHMPLPKEAQIADLDNIVFLIIPTIADFAQLQEHLMSHFYNHFVSEFKLTQILRLDQQLKDLLLSQHVKAADYFVEAFLYSDHSSNLQKAYKLLCKEGFLRASSVNEYIQYIQELILSNLECAANNAVMAGSSAPFKHSLVVLTSELCETAHGEYYSLLANCKEYLEYCIAMNKSITLEEYQEVSPTDRLQALVLCIEIDPTEISDKLWVDCHQNGQLTVFLKSCCEEIQNPEYLDELMIHFVEHLAFLDSFAQLCQVIYDYLPTHYSEQSLKLYETLGRYIAVDTLYMLFLGNKEPFSKSLLRDDNILLLAEGFIEEQNDKMIVSLFETHNEHLAPHLLVLIDKAQRLKAAKIQAFFKSNFSVAYSYAAIKRGTSIDNSSLFRIEQLMINQQMEQTLIVQLLSELAIIAEEFTPEVLYIAWIYHEIPYFIISQETTREHTMQRCLACFPGCVAKISFLNACSFIVSIDKLRLLLNACYQDVDLLITLSKDYVNDEEFIFASYEEIISAGLSEELSRILEGQKLHSNYNMAKYLFKNVDVDITLLPEEESCFYIPEHDFASTLSFVNDNFDTLVPNYDENTDSSGIPHALIFQWLMEHRCCNSDILRIQAMFLLHNCGSDIRSDLVELSNDDLMRELVVISLSTSIDARAYKLVEQNISAEKLLDIVTSCEDVNCDVVNEYYRKILPDDYVLALYKNKNYGNSMDKMSDLGKSVVLGDFMTEDELLEELMKMHEQNKSVNVINVLNRLKSRGELEGRYVVQLLKCPICDSQKNIELPKPESFEKNSNWSDSESSDKIRRDDWESSSESDSAEFEVEIHQEMPEIYRGTHINRFYTAESQAFLVEHANFDDIEISTIAETQALSLALKLYVCVLKNVKNRNVLDGITCQHLAQFVEAKKETALENAFDVVQLISGLDLDGILALFDPAIKSSALRYSVTEERLISLYIDTFDLTSRLAEEPQQLFHLYRKYPRIPEFKGIEIFEQLTDPEPLERPLVRASIEKLFCDELDQMFVLAGGCEISPEQLLDAYFMPTREVKQLQWIEKREFEREDEIKLAYALSEAQAAQFLEIHTDEMQSFSFQHLETFVIILHELSKLNENARNRIVSELEFIAEYNSTVEANGVSVFCRMPDREEAVEIGVDFLAFTTRFGMLAGALDTLEFTAKYMDGDIEVRMLLPKAQKRRIVRLPKRSK